MVLLFKGILGISTVRYMNNLSLMTNTWFYPKRERFSIDIFDDKKTRNFAFRFLCINSVSIYTSFFIFSFDLYVLFLSTQLTFLLHSFNRRNRFFFLHKTTASIYVIEKKIKRQNETKKKRNFFVNQRNISPFQKKSNSTDDVQKQKQNYAFVFEICCNSSIHLGCFKQID